jgi:hypothetical protein
LLDKIIGKPDVDNFKRLQASGHGGAEREVMEKYIRGFSSIAYARDGISSMKN